MDDTAVDPGRAMRELAVFYGSVFAITWGLATALFLAPEVVAGPGGVDSGRGQVLFFVAVCAPSTVALLLTVRARGVRGALRHVSRGVVAPGPWSATVLWLAVGALVIPVAWVGVFALSQLGSAGPTDNDLDVVGLLAVPVTLATTAFLVTDPGALGEEFGWRGYALPRLLHLLTPTQAGIVVGAGMSLWHVPAFLSAQLPQSDLNFLLMTSNWVGWGVVSAWVFLRSRGNWVAAGVLPHAIGNCAIYLGVVDVNWIWGTGTLLAALSLASLASMRRATGPVVSPAG